jgi:hypothetical protein
MGFSILNIFGDGEPRYVGKEAHEKNLKKQVYMSPMTLEKLREYGVTNETELKLEYFFYTDTEAKANELAKVLLKKGYSSEARLSASDSSIYIITGWTTKLKMSEDSVVNWTRDMCLLGYSKDCDFDGWGTKPD